MTLELTKEKAHNMHEWVAYYLTQLTTQKAVRDLFGGYQVKKVKTGYVLLWRGKDAGYAPMDASTLCSWAERLPLRGLAMEAHDWRERIFNS